MDACYGTTGSEYQNYAITILSRKERKQERQREKEKAIEKYKLSQQYKNQKRKQCQIWINELRENKEVKYQSLMHYAKIYMKLEIKHNNKKHKSHLSKHRLKNFYRGMTGKDILDKILADKELNVQSIEKLKREENNVPIYDITDVVKYLMALQMALRLRKREEFLNVPDVLHITWCIQQVGIKYYYDQIKMIVQHY